MDASELRRYVLEAFRQMNDRTVHATAAQLRAFVRNEMPSSERAALESHLDVCPPCRSQLDDLRAFLADCENTPDVEVIPPWSDFQARMRKRRAFLLVRRWGALAAALLLALGATWITARLLRKSPEQLLAAAYRQQRPFEFRLGAAAYSPVRTERGGGSSFARPAALLDAQARLAKALESKPADPELLRMRARAELLEREPGAAVDTLEKCRELDPRNPQVLADLGTAYALRGDQQNQAADWAAALEYLSRALLMRPSTAEWVFNRALVLERMQNFDQAADRWQEFLRLDPAGGWREEAQAHLTSVQEKLKKKQAAVRGLSEEPEQFLALTTEAIDAEAYLSRIAVSQWLPRAAFDGAARRALVRLAEILATGHGDSWLRNVVKARPGDALAQIAEARAANQSGEPERALRAARAAQPASANGDVRLWARFEETVSLHNLARPDECLAASVSLEQDLETHPYPWLLAQVRIERAICSFRSGALKDASSLLRYALEGSRRAGFTETELRAEIMYLDCVRFTGVTSELLAQADRALRTFWSGGFPFMQYQQIVDRLRLAAAREGQTQAALFLARSAAWAAEQSGNVLVEGPAEAALAVAAQAAGQSEEARRRMEQGDRLWTKMAPAYRAEPQLSLAELEIERGASGAALERLEGLRTAVAERSTVSIESKYHLLTGEALRRSGQTERAAAEFRLSIEKALPPLASMTTERERAGLLTILEQSSRALAGIAVEAGRTGEALMQWKAMRALDGLASKQLLHPASEPILWCLELVDAYGCWLEERDGRVVFHRLAPGKKVIEAAVARFREWCGDPRADAAQLREQGRQIYDWLLKPFEGELSTDPVLVLDLDGVLTLLPMEALEGRWAVMLSAGFGARRPQTIDARARVLVAANPAVAGAAAADFPPLPESLREAQTVRAAFAATEVVEGHSATAGAIAASLPWADIVHFAGHAYSNGEGAALVLAPSPLQRGAMDYDLLRAEDLRQQDWSRCKLAVLSACATAAGRFRGAVNPGSLVRAVTRSGCARVVASLWRVDSAATAEFMAGFYRSLADGAAPLEALRAGRQRVRSRAEWAHPYFWAAFQLYGTI